jgi:hypothetical protein
VSTLEVAFCAAPIFLSSHILPVLGERTVLYLNLLKFIVSSVEGSEGSLTTGSLAVETLNEYINFDDSKRACPMGFGVPTEAELKAETTEAKVNKVTK